MEAEEYIAALEFTKARYHWGCEYNVGVVIYYTLISHLRMQRYRHAVGSLVLAREEQNLVGVLLMPRLHWWIKRHPQTRQGLSPGEEWKISLSLFLLVMKI